MITIAIVEDDTTIREAICNFLNEKERMTCLHAFESVESLLHNLTSENLPDIILMDIGLPGMSGISGIKLIKQKYPKITAVLNNFIFVF